MVCKTIAVGKASKQDPRYIMRHAETPVNASSVWPTCSAPVVHVSTVWMHTLIRAFAPLCGTQVPQ
eukprot:366501-Chlamydomonas_euryale.AAC.9